MTGFYRSYHVVEPFLKQKIPPPTDKENIQLIEDRKKLVSLRY